MSGDVKDNLKNQSTRQRGLYGLLYTIYRSVAEIALFVMVIFRYLLPLFRGETIRRFCRLGQSIRTCVFQTYGFLNFDGGNHAHSFRHLVRVPAETGENRQTEQVHGRPGDLRK